MLQCKQSADFKNVHNQLTYDFFSDDDDDSDGEWDIAEEYTYRTIKPGGKARGRPRIHPVKPKAVKTPGSGRGRGRPPKRPAASDAEENTGSAICFHPL